MAGTAKPVRVLLIGGRSGVGKTTVSYEVSELLKERDVSHALIDGDNLDEVYPKPEQIDITWMNLAAIWRNYRQIGQRRMIYVNTVSVLEREMIVRAVGGDAEVQVTGVLLTASDESAGARLAQREIGSTLDVHVERSANASVRLESASPDWVHRVPTDGRSVREIARAVLRLSGWIDG